jgi:hypothetical protein
MPETLTFRQIREKELELIFSHLLITMGQEDYPGMSSFWQPFSFQLKWRNRAEGRKIFTFNSGG